MSLRFSVPYNNQFETLKEIVKLKNLNGNRIEEVYLSGPQEYFGSARVVQKFTVEDIIKLIDFCHENGLKVNLLLNSTCEGIEWYSLQNVSKLIRFLKKMHLEHGLDGVTIANPLFIQKVRKEFPKIEITASTLAYIHSVQKAMFYDKFGVDVITPDENINRDLKLLEEIKEAIHAKLKLLTNQECLLNCPYEIFHYNFVSHKSKKCEEISYEIFQKNCFRIVELDPSQLIKAPIIRPQDLKKYKKITNFFKIIGRTSKKEYVIDQIKKHMNEEEVDIIETYKKGVYIDNRLLPPDFFEKVSSCDKNCHKCHYCEEVAKEAVKFE